MNTLASNLTTQVRNIAQVTTAVANGDLTKKITVRGEVAELKETINTTGSTFHVEILQEQAASAGVNGGRHKTVAAD